MGWRCFAFFGSCAGAPGTSDNLKWSVKWPHSVPATLSRQDAFMSKYAYFGNMLCPRHIRYFERSINPAQVTKLFTNLAELLVAWLRVTSYLATSLRPAIDFVCFSCVCHIVSHKVSHKIQSHIVIFLYDFITLFGSLHNHSRPMTSYFFRSSVMSYHIITPYCTIMMP